MTSTRTASLLESWRQHVYDALHNDRRLFGTLLVIWIVGAYFLFFYISFRRDSLHLPVARDPSDLGAQPDESAVERRIRRRMAQIERDALLRQHRHRPSPLPTKYEEELVRGEAPALCQHWRPAACERWVQETLALRAREWARAFDRRFSNSFPAAQGPSKVRLVLRGPHFRSWWPHVIPKIAESATAECSVPCDVRLPQTPPAAHAPMVAPPDTEVVVVDTLSPGPRPPLSPGTEEGAASGRAVQGNASVAVVALETGRPNSTHGKRSLRDTDWLVSWARQSEVPINYMYAWQIPCGVPQGEGSPNTTAEWNRALERCMAPAPRTSKDLGRRRRLAAAFISNCAAQDRLDFLRELMEHLPEGSVESWGRCLRTPGLPLESVAAREKLAGGYQLPVQPTKRGKRAQNGPGRSANKVALLANRGYKFALAFENAVHRDYVTEKALHPVLAGVVPVVWGAPEAADFMPGGPGSFINAMDYESPKALAEHLMALDLDDGAYVRHFAWRTSRRGPGITERFAAMQDQSFTTLGARSWPCRLCTAILGARNGSAAMSAGAYDR